MSAGPWETTKRFLKRIPLVMQIYEKLLLSKEKRLVERRLASKERAFHRKDFEEIFGKKTNPWGYHTPHQQERIQLLCRHVPTNSSSILEIGSAEGICTRFLAQKAKRVVAMDISRTALERARIHCGELQNVFYLQADVLHPPFDNSFDVIVCAGVLVYLPEETLLRQAIQRILHALKASGLLILENMWERSGGSRAGSTIHEFILQLPDTQLIQFERQDEYGISVFQKRA